MVLTAQPGRLKEVMMTRSTSAVSSIALRVVDCEAVSEHTGEGRWTALPSRLEAGAMIVPNG